MASIRRNTYKADPYLAKAAENIAGLFAAPSGTDAAGWANANATREKAARLAELYANPTDPNFDRRNIAVGNYAPTQSFYAQDQNNATTQRGQDVTAATSRYSTDASVGASILNNQNTVKGTTIASLYGALNPGQVRPDVPENIASTIGLPAVGAVQGLPKPLSMDEVKAAALGQLPVETQQGLALAGPGTTNVVRDGKNIVESNAGAIGAEPYIAEKPNKFVNGQYLGPDGKPRPAIQRPEDGVWVDPQTKLPVQGQVTNLATPQGSNVDVGLGSSTKNNAESMLVDLTLAQSTSKSLRNLLQKNPGAQGLVGALRGTAQDVLAAGGEVGQLLNVNLDKVKKDIASGVVDPDVAAKFQNFDPSIPAANLLETLLTAQVAKVLDPNGRVSNDRYNAVAKSLGAGGLTGNAQRTLATLDALDGIIEQRRSILAPVAPAAAAVGAAQRAAPAPVAAPSTAPAPTGRLRFDANGNPM